MGDRIGKFKDNLLDCREMRLTALSGLAMEAMVASMLKGAVSARCLMLSMVMRSRLHVSGDVYTRALGGIMKFAM